MKLSVALLAVLVLVSALGLTAPTAPAPPGVQKTKVFYLHNATQDLGAGPVRIMDTVLGTPAEESEDVFTNPVRTLSWFLAPRLAGPLDLGGDAAFRVWMLLNSAGGEGTTFVDLTLNLYRIDPAGARAGGSLATGTVTVQITTHYSEYFVSASVVAVTVPAGDSLEVELTVTSSNSATKQVAWGSERFRSRLDLATTTYLTIESAAAQDAAGGTPPFFTEDEDIHLVTNISDVFGGYDVRWVNATVRRPDGTYAFFRTAMARTSGGPTSLYGDWELVYVGANKLRGVYDVTIEAVDNTGYYYRYPDRPGDVTFGGHLESVAFTFQIGEPVSVIFRVLDDLNLTLPGATVELWEGAFRRAWATTNGSGMANLSGVPGTGSYTVRVEWGGVQVYTAPVVISANVLIELRVAVYHLAVEVVDIGNVPLGGAAVFVTFSNGTSTLLPFITDPAGRATVGRVPVGPQEFRAVWLGSEVQRSTANVASSGTVRLRADVFYVDFTATDSRDLPVEGVSVLLTDRPRGLVVAAVTTDALGRGAGRLPAGEYAYEAWWSGRRVAEPTNVTVTANASYALRLAVFYVDVVVVDDENRTLLGAFVALESPFYTATGITDDQGTVSDLRAPAGPFTLAVWWDGVEIFRGPVDVTDNNTFTAPSAVYDLTILTTDSALAPVSGVFLTVKRGNVTVAAAVTSASGVAVFRLPAAQYTVTGRLVTTYLLTPIDNTESLVVLLDREKTETLTFGLFPIPFYATTLFYLILGILLTFLVLLALWWRRRKSKAGAQPVPTESGAPAGEPAEEKPKPADLPDGAAPVPESPAPAPADPAAEAPAPSAEPVPAAVEAAPAVGAAPGEDKPPAPMTRGVSDGSARCGGCHGRINEGLGTFECFYCGSAYHETCGSTLAECTTCGLRIAPPA